MPHNRMIWAVLAALAGAAPLAAAAQQPDGQANSKLAPVKMPALTPDMLKTPPEALDTASPPKVDSNGKAAPALKPPTGVSLGKYDLEFKAGQTSDVSPRTGFDSGEMSNIESVRPGKPDSVKPDYFGLKLSAPTR